MRFLALISLLCSPTGSIAAVYAVPATSVGKVFTITLPLPLFLFVKCIFAGAQNKGIEK